MDQRWLGIAATDGKAWMRGLKPIGRLRTVADRDKQPPLPAELASVQAAYETTKRALPGMIVRSAIFPGAPFGTPYHYILWAQGDKPLTARLFTPVLVDARTGALVAVANMPWYLRALEVSRPLHFGDYGGLPLKILWALLDLATIVVLGSGLYLWASRRVSHGDSS